MTAFIVNLVAKERGTNLSGKYAYKICKNFIKGFKNIDYNKVVFITGTNGKSTTNNMIINALKTAGKTVTTNLEGANLITGIATAMIKNSTIIGKIKTEYMIFETDERYLRHIYNQLPAKNICITNLQKDQVQRNGEPDFIYQKIKAIYEKWLCIIHCIFSISAFESIIFIIYIFCKIRNIIFAFESATYTLEFSNIIYVIILEFDFIITFWAR